MTTLSVPIPAALEIQLDKLVAWGVGPTRAAVTRTALSRLADDVVVQRILAASREATLYGDLDVLASQI
jgi:hypothetical protein